MSEETKVNEEAQDSGETEGLATGAKPKDKAALYRQLAEALNAKVVKRFEPIKKKMADKGVEVGMRRVFGDQDARDLVVGVLQGLFDVLLQPGEDGVYGNCTVGIPGGFGSIQLGTAAATEKRTPQGAMVKVAKRWRVKYAPGKAVDSMLDLLPAPPPDEVIPEVPATN